MPRLLLLPLLLCTAVAACSDPATHGVQADLDVSPSALSISGWVGYPAHTSLTLSSRSSVPVSATIEAEAPFTLQQDSVVVPAGATLDVEVTFAPSQEGAFEKVLTVHFEDRELKVPLIGTAQTPPQCSAGTCELSSFDPVSGQCISEVAPNGTTCSNDCLDHGECIDGVCRGESSVCDDGDACTLDACDPDTGCLHGTQHCAAPDDPCQAAVCDPVAGCTSVPVQDGTRCGMIDCEAAHICLSGTCVAQAVKPGTACRISPCAPEGVCMNFFCWQGIPDPLPWVWRYQSPVGKAISFPGTLDENGNHFFFECGGSACDLVSLDNDGAPRFRVPLPHHDFGTEHAGALSIIDGTLILSFGRDWVEAHRLSDGGLLWETNLATLLQTPHVVLLTGARSNSRVVVAVRRDISNAGLDAGTSPGAGSSSSLVALEGKTGTLAWQQGFTGVLFDAVVADEQGSVFVLTQEPQGASAQLQSVGANGLVRWKRSYAATPVATRSGRMYLSDESLVDTATGADLGRLPIRANFGGVPNVPAHETNIASPMMTGDLAYVHREDGSSQSLERYQLDPVSRDWYRPGPFTWETQSILLDTGNVLTAGTLDTTSGPFPSMREMKPDGNESFSCSLVGPPVSGITTLFHGRWTASAGPDGNRELVAYDLLDQEPATSGWLTVGGDMSRASAPR